MIHEARSIQKKKKKNYTHTHIAKQHTKAYPPLSPGQPPGANRAAFYFYSELLQPTTPFLRCRFSKCVAKMLCLISHDALFFPMHIF